MDISALDHALFWWINREATHPFLDWLMPVLSAIELWMPVLGLAILLLAWRGNKSVRWMLLCMVLAIAVADGVIGKSLKHYFGRVRPRDAMSAVRVVDVAQVKPRFFALWHAPHISQTSVKKPQQRGSSLPSNHTLNLFASAMVVLCFFRIWGIATLALACLVAYSRIYVGAHWPSDIVPSVGMGLAIGYLIVATMRRFISGSAVQAHR
jgi:undecaprenyl-diphosphatase